MEKIRVYNRSNSTVFYKDEDTNRTRTWEPSTIGKESYKDLDFEEIERVVNTRGGKILFEEYLLHNTHLERASSSRHDFYRIYEEEGQLFIKLNLQIRFKPL